VASDFLHHPLRRRHRAYYDWYRAIVSPQGASGTKYLKGDAALRMQAEAYLKGEAALASELSRYVKGDTAFRIENFVYLKSEVLFADFQTYIKGDVDLIGTLNQYLKGDARFTFNSTYFKGSANLMVTIPLDDLGESPPSTKPGVLSRHWLSVAAVKKDVT